jgi:small-conductance mechanosensitive channel
LTTRPTRDHGPDSETRRRGDARAVFDTRLRARALVAAMLTLGALATPDAARAAGGADEAHVAPAAPNAPRTAPTAAAAKSEEGHEHAAPDAPHAAGAAVRVHERVVFLVRAPRAGQSAEVRAKAASQALDAVLEEGGELEPRVEEPSADTAVIYVGKTPIVTLGPDDAHAPDDPVLHVHAATVAGKIREALRLERKRTAIATTVFSLSLLVFSGLVTFLLIGRVGDLVEKARAWLEKNSAKLPAIRLGKVEFVSATSVRGGTEIALRFGERVGQGAIAYGWVLFSLSLFAATRGWGEQLSGLVLRPLSALAGRVAGAMPLLVVAAIAALAVTVLVRFVGLFFESVARGETKLTWLPADLAAATSVLARGGIVVVALILAAPLLTGSDEGAFARIGVAVLGAIGLSCTPVLASAASGVAVLFGRKVRPGEWAEVGGHSGRVLAVGLLDVHLIDVHGCHVRVPHVRSLWHPTRRLGDGPIASVEVLCDPNAGDLHQALLIATRAISPQAVVALVGVERDGVRYRVSCPDASGDGLALSRAILEVVGARTTEARGRLPAAGGT